MNAKTVGQRKQKKEIVEKNANAAAKYANPPPEALQLKQKNQIVEKRSGAHLGPPASLPNQPEAETLSELTMISPVQKELDLKMEQHDAPKNACCCVS